MADQPFNIAKGRTVEFYNLIKSNTLVNAAFVVVILQVSEADSVLIDYDDLAAVLGAAGNTEATFTNYARKVLDDTDLDAFPAPDDTNNRFDIDLPDQVFTSAGGATNNSLVKALVCFDADTTGGTDTNIIPCAHYDFVATTDGSNLTLEVNTAGFYRAA